MLYLIKLDNAYKIGFTTNLNERIKQLSPTHLDIELISTKFGNKKDEKEIHELCNEFKLKNELFKLDINVVNIFNSYISLHLKNEINNKFIDYKKSFDLYKELCENILEKSLLILDKTQKLNDSINKTIDLKEKTRHGIFESFMKYLLNKGFQKYGYWYKLKYNNHISDWFATEIYVNYISNDKPIIICFDSAGIDKEVLFRGMIETEEDFDRVFKQLGIKL